MRILLVQAVILLLALVQPLYAKTINWQDIFTSCDRIYKWGLKSDLGRHKVSVFSELPPSYHRHQSKDGVDFFTASEKPIEHRGMKLIGIYGVADCSQESTAEKAGQCVTARPPQINMVWQSASKPSRFDVELKDRSQSWYSDEMPNTFWSYISSVRARLPAQQKLYESSCMWLFRPRVG